LARNEGKNVAEHLCGLQMVSNFAGERFRCRETAWLMPAELFRNLEMNRFTRQMVFRYFKSVMPGLADRF
jgi:hypothetical protein